MAVIPFTAAFAATRAEAFVRQFLAGRLGVRELYVGRQFAFGRNREGDLALLARLGAELGFAVFGLEEECSAGEPVSSTRIRRALAQGRVEEAAELLGRPYSLTGAIVEGDRLGRRLGWPTVNLRPEGELLPLEGVYATRVRFFSDPDPARLLDSVTNIGRRPTVPGSRPPTVETHILDFDREVYGERIELFFHKRLRDEMLLPRWRSCRHRSAGTSRSAENTFRFSGVLMGTPVPAGRSDIGEGRGTGSVFNRKGRTQWQAAKS